METTQDSHDGTKYNLIEPRHNKLFLDGHTDRGFPIEILKLYFGDGERITILHQVFENQAWKNVKKFSTQIEWRKSQSPHMLPIPKSDISDQCNEVYRSIGTAMTEITTLDFCGIGFFRRSLNVEFVSASRPACRQRICFRSQVIDEVRRAIVSEHPHTV